MKLTFFIITFFMYNFFNSAYCQSFENSGDCQNVENVNCDKWSNSLHDNKRSVFLINAPMNDGTRKTCTGTQQFNY